MCKYGIRVNIVPIGLNYYKPSAFRSKVLIDIGKAYSIPNELVDIYQKNKREAISLLLNEIENVLYRFFLSFYNLVLENESLPYCCPDL